MKGHESLIALRMTGRRPAYVAIDVGDTPQSNRLWAMWSDGELGAAFLLIEPNDRPAMLDLRCVVGMLVMVQGYEQHERLIEATHEACKAAGADRVISSVLRKKPSGEVESLRAMDSEGVLEWLTS